MKTYTAIEAAQLLGVAERTIRRWREDGKLQGERKADGSYAIPESEIERLRLERGLDQNGDQAARIEALERNLEDQARELADYKTRLEHLEELFKATWSGDQASTTRPRPAATSYTERTLILPEDIPAGSMQYADFAQLHGMNPHTFRDHLTVGIGRGLEIKDKVAHIERPIPNRSESERWLTPGQQHAAIVFWNKHGKRFIPCADCPHEQESVTLE